MPRIAGKICRRHYSIICSTALQSAKSLPINWESSPIGSTPSLKFQTANGLNAFFGNDRLRRGRVGHDIPHGWASSNRNGNQVTASTCEKVILLLSTSWFAWIVATIESGGIKTVYEQAIIS
jgi:hypothetical protein